MALIASVLVHFVPCDDFVCLFQACVDETCGRCLQARDLLSDKARHEDKTKFGCTEHIEGMLSDNCGKEGVLTALVDTEGHMRGIVAKGTVRLEKDRRVGLQGGLAATMCQSSSILLIF